MNLELNLKNIQQIAHQKKEENLSFRTFLEQQDSATVDALVHRLDKELTPQISCVECGNCCQNLRPIATEEVLTQFVEPKNMGKFKYSSSFPCKNLIEKKCTIYLDRPEECREFPYLHRNEFITRILGVLQNYEICPIVFNVFEHLKLELNWKGKT